LAWASSRASPCAPRSLIDDADIPVDEHFSLAFGVGNDMPAPGMGNPVQRGHRFQRKADTNPVIADSG